MDTLAALFPVARPRGAASVFIGSGPEGRARLAEAVALAFAVREPAPPLGAAPAMARL
jgi:hypothetical protein